MRQSLWHWQRQEIKLKLNFSTCAAIIMVKNSGIFFLSEAKNRDTICVCPLIDDWYITYVWKYCSLSRYLSRNFTSSGIGFPLAHSRLQGGAKVFTFSFPLPNKGCHKSCYKLSNFISYLLWRRPKSLWWISHCEWYYLKNKKKSYLKLKKRL